MWFQALKKLPSFFNRSNLTVTDEYRENFLKAEATFKHQYVYDPLDRSMVRLTEPDDEGTFTTYVKKKLSHIFNPQAWKKLSQIHDVQVLKNYLKLFSFSIYL